MKPSNWTIPWGEKRFIGDQIANAVSGSEGGEELEKRKMMVKQVDFILLLAGWGL